MNRIDKLLAHEGLGSRKDIKKMLRSCEVMVNGVRIYDAGFLIDEEKDVITVDGEEINIRGQLYLMMNKIAGTVSSNKDGEHRTVFDLLGDEYRTPFLEDHLHLVGRLDMDTEGFLLFTTDGELTHRLISPKSHVSKTYFVGLNKVYSEAEKRDVEEKFRKGIHIEADGSEEACDCLPAEVKWPDADEIKKYCGNSSQSSEEIKQAALLTIYEGKYHQVKRMFAAAGNHVDYLKRISMGSLNLDKDLALGKVRELTDSDIEKLV